MGGNELLNTININLKTDIKTDRPTTLPIKLMSQDKNNNQFILRFTNGVEKVALDDTYTVDVLTKFTKSGASRLTTAKVRQDYATWGFDTAYITQDEKVVNYVYVRKAGSLVVSADANAFAFDVGLSEIDKDAGRVAEMYDENYQKYLDEFKGNVDFEEIAQSETERIQAEQARKEAETLREESYEQKVDTAIVEADVVEKVDNKVTELTPQINNLTAHLDYKEINVFDYEEYLVNDDWTTVIHKIFEENESGVIKFPVGAFKFKTPIGRIKNNFIITGVNRYQTTFNIDLTGDYFVRAGLNTGFTNIGIRIDYNSSYPINIFEYNSNALGVKDPGRTWVFDVNNIYFDNTYANVAEDRLPNLFGVYAQNFDDNGVVNNFCSYVMYFNPHNIKFEGVNKFVDFKLTQKDGGNTVWATEVNFEKVTGMRLKKGLEIRIDNQSSSNLSQTSDIYLTDCSFQGNREGAFGNEKWTQTEFLNVYGDERGRVTVNLQGANKFWDTGLSGYLDYGHVEINGEFLYSNWDSGLTKNRKLGFVLGRNSAVHWTGANPNYRTIEKGNNDKYLRVDAVDDEDGGVGEIYRNSPDYYNYNTGFLTDFKSFHPFDDPDRTSDNITEFYNIDHGRSKLTSIKWGDIRDFEISVRNAPTLKHRRYRMNRPTHSETSEWYGANGSQFESGGYGSEYSLASGESVVHQVSFKKAFDGIPFVASTLYGSWGSTFAIVETVPTRTGAKIRIKNIGETSGATSLQWLAIGGGY